MCVLQGFPTALAKTSTSFPFGLWFANADTLYVADEGNGDTTFDPSTGHLRRRGRADHRGPAEVGLRRHQLEARLHAARPG